jgi:hypothetical protein
MLRFGGSLKRTGITALERGNNQFRVAVALSR